MRLYQSTSTELTATAKIASRIGNTTQIVIGTEASPLSIFLTKTELRALCLGLIDALAAMPEDDAEVAL